MYLMNFKVAKKIIYLANAITYEFKSSIDLIFKYSNTARYDTIFFTTRLVMGSNK